MIAPPAPTLHQALVITKVALPVSYNELCELGEIALPGHALRRAMEAPYGKVATGVLLEHVALAVALKLIVKAARSRKFHGIGREKLVLLTWPVYLWALLHDVADQSRQPELRRFVGMLQHTLPGWGIAYAPTAANPIGDQVCWDR